MSPKKQKTIGVLTGGGDCPGLNAALRAVAWKGLAEGFRVTGFVGGWKGLLHNETTVLDQDRVSGILREGGTILRSSRTNPLESAKNKTLLRQGFDKHRLEGLIVLGGEGTLRGACAVAELGFPVIGIPKTIDNDVPGTDETIGFATAVQYVTEAIDRLHTTAASHDRVLILEVMGRYQGWIAAYAGLAGGADGIWIPEVAVTPEDMLQWIEERRRRGKRFAVLVVAEGVALSLKKHPELLRDLSPDPHGHPDLHGIGEQLAQWLDRHLDCEVRAVNLSYLQRGGSPVARDRILASQFGVAAVELIRKKQFSKLVGLRRGRITTADLAIVKRKHLPVPQDVYKLASTFFG